MQNLPKIHQQAMVEGQNYMFASMPRMTNTFMMNGKNTREEMIKSVKKGILC